MTERRLTVREAAEELGITVDAVRMRIRRGSLTSEKYDERVYVRLDTDEDTDQTQRVVEGSMELVEQLRSEVEYLREENRRKDQLLAGLISRVPQLESREPGQDASSRDTAPGEGSYPGGDEGGAENAAQRGSWWRRIFGG